MINKIIGGLLLLLVVVGVSVSGCIENSNSQVNEMISLLPKEYNGFIYVNFMNLKNKEYESEYRSKILNALGLKATGEDNGEKTGIYLNKTESIIISGNSNNYYDINLVMIIQGKYDLDKFKKYLKDDRKMYISDYKGFEIYSDNENDEFALTIYNDKIIAGTKKGVYDCIDVIKGDKEPLTKNEKVMEIFNKLPSDACMMTVSVGKSWDNTIGRGFGIIFEDNDKVKAYIVEKFENEEIAKKKYEKYLKELDEYKEKKPDIKASVKLDGLFVIRTAEGPEKELRL